MLETLGYLAAIFMGTVLGLVGGGGSILTVPILVYLIEVSPLEATAYSLFIVGLSSLFGSIDYIRRGLIDFKVGMIFTIPAFVGVYLTRRFLMPSLPKEFNILQVQFSQDTLILGVFAVIMLLAAWSMIRSGDRKSPGDSKNAKLNIPVIAAEGLVVGAVTGFVGAGGGFLIIPALVILAGLEIKTAVGTSLLIIAIKSLLGFTGDIQVMPQINWSLLLVFTGFSSIGIFLGLYLSRIMPGKKLKPAFGWFVLVMASMILLKQFS